MRKLAAIVCAAVGCHRPSPPTGGGAWTRVPLDLADDAVIDSLSGTSSRDVWLAAQSGDQRVVRHFDGDAWRAVDVPVRGAMAIHAYAPDDVWAVGRAGTVAHFDGATWTAMQVPGLPLDLVDVAVAGGRVVAATAGPRVQVRDGGSWRTDAPPELTGAGIFRTWAAGPDVLMPINRRDRPITLARFDGRWRFDEIGPGAGVALAGTSATDVWLLSPRTAYHFDGATWASTALPGAMLAIAGDAARAITAGEDGAVAIWDGHAWRADPSGTRERLRAAFVAPDGTAWIGGARLYRRSLP